VGFSVEDDGANGVPWWPEKETDGIRNEFFPKENKSRHIRQHFFYFLGLGQKKA
jgi:hypothetical protein